MEGSPPGTIWSVDDFHNAQVREVYARYGLAMYLVQVLEHGLVNAILVLRLMPTMREHADRGSWEAAFDRFYDVELGKTFGNILRALEKIDGFPSDLMGRLQSSKVDRDHLAHRFFRVHDLDFMTPEGRVDMIAECEELIERFQTLDHDVEAFAAPQRERFGITPEWVEERIAIMEQEALAKSRQRSTT